MKLMKLSVLLAVALAISFASTGCKKKPTGVTPLPGRSKAPVGGGNSPYTEGGPGMNLNNTVVDSATGGTPLSGLDEFEGMLMDPSAFAAHTVRFAYDSSAVRSSDQGNVDAVAAALSAEPMNKVLIEGHCDERGTEGYNMSLGERRALSLREALGSRGVSPDRVRTISYGEAKPAVDGHDESAWSANRRGEFILLRPKP